MLTNNGAQAGHDSPEIRIRGVGTFEHNDPMVDVYKRQALKCPHCGKDGHEDGAAYCKYCGGKLVN